MSKYRSGGFIKGGESIRLYPGPIREAINPGPLESYADECFVNSLGVCVRNDEWHRSVPIPDRDHRFWVCRAHD